MAGSQTTAVTKHQRLPMPPYWAPRPQALETCTPWTCAPEPRVVSACRSYPMPFPAQAHKQCWWCNPEAQGPHCECVPEAPSITLRPQKLSATHAQRPGLYCKYTPGCHPSMGVWDAQWTVCQKVLLFHRELHTRGAMQTPLLNQSTFNGKLMNQIWRGREYNSEKRQ